jgi:hypothetical protein
MGDLAGTVGARFARVRPFLNEFQRRVWLGAEAAELGEGGAGL